MKSFFRTGFAFRVWLLLPFLPLAAAAQPVVMSAEVAPPTIPGQLVLRLRPAFRPVAAGPGQPQSQGRPALTPALANALRQLAATDLRPKFPHSPAGAAAPTSVAAAALARPAGPDLSLLYQITVPAGLPLAKARALLLSSGTVEYVEPLYIRQPLGQYVPNDPGANPPAAPGQYYLKAIKAYEAWDLYKGDPNIVIGLTDGGARLTHEDLRNQVRRNLADPVDGIDNDEDGYVDNYEGWDLANNDRDAGFDARASRGAILHGSWVAGIMAGEADNGRGVAGVGFRTRFLPLSIYPTTAAGSFGGYEAIVYAADHGCQVINLSWGAPGGYSRFEQDVITYAAVTRDVVVVAAAGNAHADVKFYPASYEHVISVSAVDALDRLTLATFNRRVDITAPGLNILTVRGAGTGSGAGPTDADYEYIGYGTSFSAPQVSGAAALVRGRFPRYTAAQVVAQLRQTADNVEALPANAPVRGRMGMGRLNVLRALSETDRREARVVRSRFGPARVAYVAGELVQVSASIVNLLAPLQDVRVELSSLSPYLTVEQERFAAGSLAPLDSAHNRAAPFRVRVAGQGIPLNTTATLRYRVTAADGYESFDYVDIKLNPDYVTLDAGNLALTLTSRGSLGYDDLSGELGEGAVYRGGVPLLSEGGLLLATSASRVSDRLRGAPRGSSRQSFFSLSQARRRLAGPTAGPITGPTTGLAAGPVLAAAADQEARVFFQDSLPALNPVPGRSLGVRVRLRGLSWAAAPRRDFVLLEYTLKNIGPDPLEPLLAGLFMDWDLPGDAARNTAVWDEARQLGYCYDPAAARQFAGVRLLRGGTPLTYAIDNNAPVGTPVHFGNGFSRAEKFLTLSSGTTVPTAGTGSGADVSQVVGAHLGRVAAGDSVTVVFAVVAAPTLAGLQAAADAALTADTQVLLAARRATGAAAGWHLFPNPTTGPLRLELPAGFGAAEVRVTDALGRLVRQQPVRGTTADLDLDDLAPGAYTVRVVGSGPALSRLVLRR